MKKIQFFGFLAGMLVLVMLLTGCATLNQENVENGRIFRVYQGQYDGSKPIEEHSFLLNTERDFIINGNIRLNSVVILQPGQRNIRWEYEDSFNKAIGMPYQSGSGNINFYFEPGEYYYFSAIIIGSQISLSIENIRDARGIYLLKDRYNSEYIPSSSIITGISYSIEKGDVH